MTQIIFPELSFKIVGFCFDVHNEQGRFLRERQYTDQLEKYLINAKIIYCREKEIQQTFDTGITGNLPDFIIEDKIILDLKAKRLVTKEDYYQMCRYLQISNMRLGIIINFRDSYLKPKRVLNSKLLDSNHSTNSHS